MFVDNLKDFKNHCKYTTCIISENDPYVKLADLKSFASLVANKTINIKDGGHFNADSGYGEKFEKLLDLIKG